jgi:hypothetical protein
MAVAVRRVMAASDVAVREIAKVLLKHVDQRTLRKVLEDLLDIRGNRSFRDTIETLAHELKAKL